jgi:trehalose/maltose transport system permease protein
MQSRVRIAWVFLIPMMVLMLLVAGWPLARSLWFSLTETNINDMSASKFIGLANYFGEYGLFFNENYSDGFWKSDWGVSIKNTFQFAIASVVLETLAGLGVAMLLNQEFKGRALVRTAVLIPWAIPTVVSAKMWGWMLHDQFGVVNHWLAALHLIHGPVAWTADPTLSLLSVVAVDVWKTTPFMALLILAALQTVPGDCYEAAAVDGVPPRAVFLRITLPLIAPGVAVAVVFRLLDALRVFDLVYVMTANSRATRTMSVYVREQLIDFQQVGYGSAAATVLFLVIALSTFATLRALRSSAEDAS